MGWVAGDDAHAVVSPLPAAAKPLWDAWTPPRKGKKGKKAPQYTEEELDLLALFFTLVKVLFVSGALRPLPVERSPPNAPAH